MKNMKVVMISNFFNHHQKYLSDSLFEVLNGEYRFIASTAMADEQKKLGYAVFQNIPYLINAFEDEASLSEAERYIRNAEVVILGSVNSKVISPNLYRDKLCFKYSERILKTGNPPFWKYVLRMFKMRLLNRGTHNTYLLCASAFAAADYAKFGLYKDKALKWGYFPETKYYDIDSLIQAKSKTSILWCGRMLDWKHPDDVVTVAAKLKQAGYQFDLNLIGNGELYPILEKMIAGIGIGDCVHLLGAKPSDEVRGYMEKAGIYLFTSDRQEGWGAVLNESMNSGCAVIASHAIGSVPYLVKSGENGYVYCSGDVEELYQKVKYLLDHPEKQERMGRYAYKTIATEWNASNAAERFVSVAKQLLEYGEIKSLPKLGPCSKAEIVTDDWIQRVNI